MGILDDFQWGQDIHSPGNWDQSEKIRALAAMDGKKMGEWSAPDENGIRYIDTPFGRVDNSVAMQLMAHHASGQESGHWDPKTAYGSKNELWRGVSVGNWHKNEHGKDQVQGLIDKDGVYHFKGMDRQSRAKDNMIIGSILALPLAAYAAGGSVGGVSGIGAGTGATPGVVGTSATGAGGVAGAGGAGAAGASGAGAGGAAAEGVIPPATDYGAPMNMVGGEAAAGGAPISAATPSAAGGSAVGSTTTPTLTQSLGNLSSSALSGGGDWWPKLLLQGISGALQGYQTSRNNEAQAERDKEKHDREVAETQRQEQWKVRNMNVENMPKLNWAPFKQPEKPVMAKPPKWGPTQISDKGIISRTLEEEDE